MTIREARQQNSVSPEIRANIELLMNEARSEIEAADKAGDSQLFTELGLRYGPIAYRVYLALDLPHRDCERYHDQASRRIMLDPWTVFNRTRSYGIRDTWKKSLRMTHTLRSLRMTLLAAPVSPQSYQSLRMTHLVSWRSQKIAHSLDWRSQKITDSSIAQNDPPYHQSVSN